MSGLWIILQIISGALTGPPPYDRQIEQNVPLHDFTASVMN